ncbi:MAG: membrane dipeptidase [Lachnospiraceae bacterium]|nr:membrane dipeptidase [Lachnospiraceae bacterium]
MKIIDMHCDTIHKIWKANIAGKNKNLASDDYMLNISKMENGGYAVQNFAMFIEAYEDNERIDCYRRFEDLYKEFINQTNAYCDRISIVTNAGEIEENMSEGRLSALLTVEGGEACRGDIEKLSYLYDKGVRMMTLTWNYINELGHPNINGMKRNDSDFSPFVPDVENGLTETGIEFVKAMEDIGMIVDVSHLSDAGFCDVYNNTKKPFVASHSNAREVCPFVRNLTDDMIRKLGERGGVTGLNYCRDFLFTSDEEREIDKQALLDKVATDDDKYLDITCDKIVEHARHIVNVGGMGVLGLGSDFDGIHNYVGMPQADKMEYLAHALHKKGFSDDRIDDIFFNNVMRVYREVL